MVMVSASRVVVIGSGVAGLSAAAMLAQRGFEVTVVERDVVLGGKLRTESVAGRSIDVGPTVLTMPEALERVFADAGASLTDYVVLRPLERLARHDWTDGSSLDLYPSLEQTIESVAAFAGPKEALGYRAFASHAARIHELVAPRFLGSQRPTLSTMWSEAKRVGPRALLALDGHRTMWSALSSFFDDPRLLQLFGRYATYCGSSPFTAPGTLNVIAHVERLGVWSVQGGMGALARGLARLVNDRGVEVRLGEHVSEILVDGGRVRGVALRSGEVLEASHVVFNGDVGALSKGLLGRAARFAAPRTRAPSLSAVTLACVGETRGRKLVRHNLFFSDDCAREFRELDQGRLPTEPTLYVCAQDREDVTSEACGAERLFVIVNAPPIGRGVSRGLEEGACEELVWKTLERFGLSVSTVGESVVTTPTRFAERFPGTGGSIYGPATAGMTSSFTRAEARTKVPGLYLAGGSAHPGAGVPMAATSGWLAVEALLSDLRSTSRWRPTATRGGTSMPSATTGTTASS